jgi:hypothetical protein
MKPRPGRLFVAQTRTRYARDHTEANQFGNVIVVSVPAAQQIGGPRRNARPAATIRSGPPKSYQEIQQP